jgi:hypothetical protein
MYYYLLKNLNRYVFVCINHIEITYILIDYQDCTNLFIYLLEIH